MERTDRWVCIWHGRTASVGEDRGLKTAGAVDDLQAQRTGAAHGGLLARFAGGPGFFAGHRRLTLTVSEEPCCLYPPPGSVVFFPVRRGSRQGLDWCKADLTGTISLHLTSRSRCAGVYWITLHLKMAMGIRDPKPDGFFSIRVLFSCRNKKISATVALSFVCGKYCSNMD